MNCLSGASSSAYDPLMKDKQVFLGEVGRLVRDLARMRKRPHSFVNRGGLSAVQWQARARAVLMEAMSCPFDPVPLDVREEDRRECDGYFEERVSFASTSVHRVAGVVLVPREGRPPFPAVVALHDHGGFYIFGKEKIVAQPSECEALRNFKRDGYEGRSWASELARRGYLVIAVDALGWGERNFYRQGVRDPVRLEDRSEESAQESGDRNEPNVKASAHMDLHTAWAGISWGGIVNWDDRRTVDYLLSRRDVDPARIACLGLSGGGFRSTYLFGSDPRMAAAGIVGWMTRLSDQLLHDMDCHVGMFNPLAVCRMMDHPDVAALGAPKPLFVQQCAQDILFPLSAMRGAVEDLAAVYRAWNAETAFRAQFYDQPHCFNIQMQEEMFDWLDQVLGGAALGRLRAVPNGAR